MTGLPIDLQKLPPHALDVIRFLGKQDDGASSDEIVEGTGLSERAFGKAIRRLVTRYYVEMPVQEYYTLSASGQDAAQILREYDGEDSATAPAAPPPVAPAAEHPAEAAVAWHMRRLSVFLAKELVERSTAKIRVGFDPPGDGAPLNQPARVILRVNAPGCDTVPVERPLEVQPGVAAGPVEFRLTPRQPGAVRVRIEAFQLVSQHDLQPVGGMFFDLPVAAFPTPDSAQFQALAAGVRLHPGGA